MPTCQAFYCTNLPGRTEKVKVYSVYLKPKIQLSGKERSNGLAIWVGQDIQTFKFGKDFVLCENHFR